MAYRVMIPSAASEQIPQGAALLMVSGGRGSVYHDPRESFAECCAQAARSGRVVALPEDCQQVAIYDEYAGELRPDPRGGVQQLETWLGKRIWRNDLEARDNRTSRRARARSLAIQGRTAEAFRLDRRLGF